jgi:hypothetical protein
MNQRLLHFPDDRSVPVTTISTRCDLRCPQRPPIGDMPHLDLSADEAAALTQELHDIVESDRYPFSPLRIRTLTTILAKLDTPAPLRAGMVPRVVRGRRRV